MKKAVLLIIPVLLILLQVLFVGAMPYKPKVFCERQGYEETIGDDGPNCYFGNNESCDLRRFYNGTCGQEYRKRLSCRKEGEPVFPEFESCCEGLKAAHPTSNWPFGGLVVMGPQKCFPQHEVFIHENLLAILSISLISLGAIVSLIFKKKFF